MSLKGIKVIELAGLAPAPFCGMLLADFGASVIRIDRPGAADLDPLGNGKRSIALNLKSQKGINIFKKLTSDCDVLIDPYRKGVMEKLKLGPADLMASNKKLIYARLTGFGQTGPYSTMAGHDINFLSLSGLLSIFGRYGQKPTPPNNFAADFGGGGLMCAFGIVMALFERCQSNKGQVIDASMVEGSAYLGSWFFRSKNSSFWNEPRGKNILDGGSHFYDTYETKDGKYMAAGALEPQFYAELLEKLNLSEDELPHFENFEENREKLTKIFKTKTQAEWCKIFDNSDACVTPVLAFDQVANHVHNISRNSFVTGKDNVVIPNPAPRLSRTPGISCATLFCRTSTIEIKHDKYVPRFEVGENTDRIFKANPSMPYNQFFENFLITNRICIFDADITKDWSSRRNWSFNDAPNFEWFKDHFGDCKVPIADCNKKYFNAQQKDNMFIKTYIDYWMDYRNCSYPNNMPLLYLKDWHCMKTNSNISIYDVPKFFASDWLNEFYIAHPNLNDDYMFVYMGPKGTWTPLHVDVFTSYSWSANIVGRKRWLFFPPGQENYLKNINGDFKYNLTSTDLDNALEENANHKSLISFEVIQEAGQIIFVPSGWYHQVWNLEDTISINHNWINGCNIWNVWISLKKELSAVMKEIEDCKDMDDWTTHCQTMLKASFGMNYLQFYELLSFIADKRLNSVINNVPEKSFDKWYIGRNHCLYDLQRIKIVLKSFMENTGEKNINSLFWKKNEIQLLLDRINETLDN